MSKEKNSKKNATTSSESSSNPTIDNPYAESLETLQKKVKQYWKPSQFFDPTLSRHQRNKLWEEELDGIGMKLVEKYSWACPDSQALRIIKNFSPIVEIGCGKGYWAKLLREMGVDVKCFDKYTGGKKGNWTEVEKGGPEKLSGKSMQGRTLFLCYPDEAESMAASCLDVFTGEIVIHVGELMTSGGTYFGPPQAPFGRTSSADFQVQLAENFHCLLVADLQHRFPYSRDTISVWKRTVRVEGKEHAPASEEVEIANTNTNSKANKQAKDAEKGDAGGGGKKSKKRKAEGDDMNGGGNAASAVEFVSLDQLAMLREASLDIQYNEEDEAMWSSIPYNELLPTTRAAPILAHLLDKH